MMEDDKDDQYLTDVLSYSAERLAKVNREYYYVDYQYYYASIVVVYIVVAGCFSTTTTTRAFSNHQMNHQMYSFQ